MDQKQCIIKNLIKNTLLSQSQSQKNKGPNNAYQNDNKINNGSNQREITVPKENDTPSNVDKNVVIIGDSLLGGIQEKGFQKIAKNNNIKIKCHRRVTTEDLLDHINPV